MKKRELEANLTSIRLELSENEHLKFEAETERDDLAKVGFRKDFFILHLVKFIIGSAWYDPATAT